MSNSATAEPKHEPDRLDISERNITARWNVGTSNGEGWQTQAQLEVHYWMGSEYSATLTTVQEQNGDGFVSVAFDPHGPSVLIYTQPARRLHPATLAKVYQAALTELRRRFAARDTTVTAYFEPTTDPAITTP